MLECRFFHCKVNLPVQRNLPRNCTICGNLGSECYDRGQGVFSRLFCDPHGILQSAVWTASTGCFPNEPTSITSDLSEFVYICDECVKKEREYLVEHGLGDEERRCVKCREPVTEYSPVYFLSCIIT